MNVLILKHAEIEGPGLIEDVLVQQKIPYQTIDLYFNTPLPKPEDFTHIVILGRLMNVYEDEHQKIEVLTQAEKKIKSYKQRGMNFFRTFFKPHGAL